MVRIHQGASVTPTVLSQSWGRCSLNITFGTPDGTPKGINGDALDVREIPVHTGGLVL